MILLLLMLTLVFPDYGISAFLRQHEGAYFPRFRSGGFADAFWWNPGRLLNFSRFGLSFSQTDLFGIRELRYQTLCLGVATPLGTIGSAVKRYGGPYYTEQTIALVWAKALPRHLIFGGGVNRYLLRIPGYGSGTAWGIDLGATWPLRPDLHWEIAYLNLNSPCIGRAEEYLSRQINTALIYLPDKQLTGAVFLIHELGFPLRWGMKTECCFLRRISASIELIDSPAQWGIGASLILKNVEVSYDLSAHPVLPYTHSLGLHFIH